MLILEVASQFFIGTSKDVNNHKGLLEAGIPEQKGFILICQHLIQNMSITHDNNTGHNYLLTYLTTTWSILV